MGSTSFKPRLLRIGSPKAIKSPVTPIQKQHETTHTKITISQGFFPRASDVGGSGPPAASFMILLDGVAYEGDGQSKGQYYNPNDTEAQSQAKLNISQYQAGSCHAIA